MDNDYPKIGVLAPGFDFSVMVAENQGAFTKSNSGARVVPTRSGRNCNWSVFYEILREWLALRCGLRQSALRLHFENTA